MGSSDLGLVGPERCDGAYVLECFCARSLEKFFFPWTAVVNNVGIAAGVI